MMHFVPFINTNIAILCEIPAKTELSY